VGLFDRWRRRRSSPGQTDQGVFPIFPVAGQDQGEKRENERGGEDERADGPALDDVGGDGVGDGGGGGNDGGGGNGGGGE
jgi:hypothetical protein